MNIQIVDLSARYEDKTVLSHVNISFESHELTGLIGPNGSGKSTLLKCIYRVVKPFGGEIILGDKKISEMSYKESAKGQRYWLSTIAALLIFL